MVKYLSKPPPLTNEDYYEDDSNEVNESRQEVFDHKPKTPIRRIGAKVKEIKV